MYEAHADRVLAYALRRVQAEDAAEIVSETFLIAWRRLDLVPDDAIPWLFGVARKVVGNRRRSLRRRAALRDRLEEEAARRPRLAADPADQVEARMAVRAALARLSERDREALMLVAWDGLDARRAAAAEGVPPGGFAVRLHRARRRLERELVKELPRAGHEPDSGRVRATGTSKEARWDRT
ncbi:MAG: sigma-70 family RNA polymerase sigma factor [Actinomycetota bacterium]|nr:sigma-70 family RNA polymerase sigma factor [Actinomycetota bacterium]